MLILAFFRYIYIVIAIITFFLNPVKWRALNHAPLSFDFFSLNTRPPLLISFENSIIFIDHKYPTWNHGCLE
jgi:hypothetical protein